MTDKPDMPLEVLEQRLRQIPTAPLSDALKARLLATRPHPRTAGRWRRLWLPLAAAAAVCVAVGLHLARPAAPTGRAEEPTETVLQPVECADYLFDGHDLGIYHAPDGRPYRVVQCIGIRRQSWADAGDRTRVDYDVTEQRVLLVAMNTY